MCLTCKPALCITYTDPWWSPSWYLRHVKEEHSSHRQQGYKRIGLLYTKEGCFGASQNATGVIFSKGLFPVLKKQNFVDFFNHSGGASFLGQEHFLVPLQTKQTSVFHPALTFGRSHLCQRLTLSVLTLRELSHLLNHHHTLCRLTPVFSLEVTPSEN